jgi:hypothetical protein
MYCICVLEDIEFFSFYDFSIGEVMYCICVLGDIGFVSISIIFELFQQCGISCFSFDVSY